MFVVSTCACVIVNVWRYSGSTPLAQGKFPTCATIKYILFLVGLLLIITRKSNKEQKIHKIFNVIFLFYSSSIQARLSPFCWWDFSPPVPPEEPAFFFLALLSLAKALVFFHCSFLPLAEASLSLAFIALGRAGNAYVWSYYVRRKRRTQKDKERT